MDQLKQGKVPKEYKPFTQKGEKKFSSKATFIQNKRLEEEYKNRSN
jgi:hypothetical protein